MDGVLLAVVGRSCRRVVRVHDPGGVAEHAARRLAKVKLHRGIALGSSSQIRGELRLAVEPVGHVIEDLHILVEHVHDRLHVLAGEGVGESLSQALDLLSAHCVIPPTHWTRPIGECDKWPGLNDGIAIDQQIAEVNTRALKLSHCCPS